MTNSHYNHSLGKTKKKCLYTALKTTKHVFSERGNLDPIVKALFSSCKLGYLQPQTFQKNTLVLFLFITVFLVKYLSFQKEVACLPLLAGKSSESTFSLISVTIGMRVNTYRKLFPDLFSHVNGSVCNVITT